MELRIREVDEGAGRGKEEALPRKDTEKHGIKMRRQKKDWTSAYAKVTNARGGKAEALPRNYTEKPEAEERTRRSIATELHGKTRNQNAQAEERLDFRIREGDEGVG